ncbi:CinA family protein [Buchananella hordeovulneris]|uniref:CinA family protein n=1 Tax=Buchananella hordeovulneris TaxID=52770 RepID=UPI001FEFE1F1|nr:nicotinamide-nucleotide amidohydrolase family protein [Buchananella hordeovulneris]
MRQAVPDHEELGWQVAAAAERLLRQLRRLHYCVATAESLTGGLVCASLAAVNGASLVLRGGIVAYQEQIKRRLLGVDAQLLADKGTVDAEVARQLADGAARTLAADLALATTGAAGPTGVGAHPPGTGFIALALPTGQTLARAFAFAGDRNQVRLQVTAEILAWAEEQVSVL